MIKVDCHFHPNLLLSLNVTKKVKAIRSSFEQHDLDAVLVCEHAYKKPLSAFYALLEWRPVWHKTHLIPWCECVTKEWIDVIVFAKDIWFDAHPHLLTPKQFSFQKLISYIDGQEELYWIVTHPFLPSKTALWKHIPSQELIEICKKNKLVEIYNWSFTNFRIVFQTLSKRVYRRIFEKKISAIENCDSLTWNFEEKVVFAWSDAHHIKDIWSHLRLATLPFHQSEYSSIFEALVNHNTKREVIIYENTFLIAVLDLIRNSCTVFVEWAIKKLHLYQIFND